MDKKKKIEDLQKRLEAENERESKNPFHKGENRGNDDAFDFSYDDFMKYEDIIKKYAGYGIDSITGEEPEIKELYKDVRSKNMKNIFNIEIDRVEGSQVVEGNYNVVITKKTIFDPLDNIPEGRQNEYYKGWIIGIFPIYQKLK